MGNWVVYSDTLAHHGILGMKWGIRRYQNEDGSLTPAGKKRYYDSNGKLTEKGRKEYGSQHYANMVAREKEERNKYKANGQIREIKDNDGSTTYEKYINLGGDDITISSYMFTGASGGSREEITRAFNRIQGAFKNDKVVDSFKDVIVKQAIDEFDSDEFDSDLIKENLKLYQLNLHGTDRNGNVLGEANFEHDDWFDDAPYGDHSMDIEFVIDRNGKVKKGSYASING